MSRTMRRGALVLLAFSILIQLAASTPRLTPKDEAVFKSGNNFQLVCEANKPLEWKLPNISHHIGTQHNLNGRTKVTNDDAGATGGFRYRSTLDVTSANYMDTGYYACHHKGNDDLDNFRVAAKTYVYVEDEEHFIVNGGEEVVSIQAIQSKREVIPCKPSSPLVEMTLELYGEVIDVSSPSSSWSYDPKEGYITNNVATEMTGYYDCIARRPGVEDQRMSFHFDVIPPTDTVLQPIIDDSKAHQVTIGQTFQLNCSVTFTLGVRGDIIWKVPNPNGIDGIRIRTEKLKDFRVSQSDKVFHQVLIVTDSTEEDEGNYICKAKDHNNLEESTSVYVQIHDTNDAYVNILEAPTTGDDSPSFEVYGNETVKWIVRFEAYPTPQVIWSRGKDAAVIKKNAKYQITTETRQTVLEITNVELADSGVYRLVISNGNETQQQTRNLNFTLLVRDKPSAKMEIKQSTVGNVIQQGEHFQIECKILAHPKIFSYAVLFREMCPGDKGCTGGSSVWTVVYNSTQGIKTNRNEETFNPSPDGFQTTRVRMTGRAKVTGRYLCKAINNIGESNVNDDEANAMIYVNDLSTTDAAVNGSELTRATAADPVDGEQFHLSCGVSLFNFSRQLTWTWTDSKGKKQELIRDKLPPGMRMSSENRTYSYVEQLVWPVINKTAAGTYTCRAKKISTNAPVDKSVSFLVRNSQPPAIANSSEAHIAVEHNEGLTLFCHVNGLPLPTAKWFKDEQLVTEGVTTTDEGSTLKVEHVKASHAGSYKCQFSNHMGRAEEVFDVQVNVAGVGSGIIAAIVIVILIVFVLLGILIRKIRQDKKRKAFFRANQLDIFDKGNPESINPDLPIDEQTELLPYDKRWEFPRANLKLGKQLGAGAFGRVVKAEATGIDRSENGDQAPREPVTIVAVKMVRSHGNMIGLKALMSELKIMIHLGSHLNVVNLLGACTKHVTKGELLVIVEYCRYGNIQNYLIRRRWNFIHQVDHRGNIDASIGADRIAQAQQQKQQQQQRGDEGPPRSPLGTAPDYSSGGGAPSSATGATEFSFLSMSPTGGGTGQSDLVDAVDSSGHPTLTSAPSNSSGGGGGQYPPWRSNYKGDYRDEPDQPLCTRDLLCWAFQIARGMDYLARRKILHGDLAARNVLLADDNIVKIADFGLAREVYRSGNYKKKGEGPLPVKWMAIESIIDRVFSTQSDVWSFGIVLWELFSLGKTPYPGTEADEQFFIKLQKGYRMDRPKYSTQKVYDIMRECWLHDPTARPDFMRLSELLGDQLDASVRRHYIDLNDAYVQANAASTSATDSPDYLSMMSPVDYVNVGSRSSPMPPQRQQQQSAYVNIPTNSDDDDLMQCGNRQSQDYLTMGTSPPANDGANYLMMLASPKAADIDASQFDFSSDHHRELNKTMSNDKMTLGDSVELHPIMSAVPNGFSNPNYLNPPSVNCATDLDDPPKYPDAIKKSPSQPSPQHYVNVAAVKAPSPRHAKSEEPEELHYVNPKNNSRVSP